MWQTCVTKQNNKIHCDSGNGPLIIFIMLQKGSGYEVEHRLSFLEGARDVAILDAMLESGSKQGALVQVKKF